MLNIDLRLLTAMANVDTFCKHRGV